MRIAFDLSSATPARTGIGTYTYELARRLVRSREHQWVLLFNSLRQPSPDLPEFRASHVRLLHRRIPGPLLLKSWQHAALPDIEWLTGGSVDLFHSPATYIPPQRNGVRVTTVHDLYFLQPGANKAPLGGGYLEWVVKNRLGEMDLILTDAPSVAREVGDLVRSGETPAALAENSGGGERRDRFRRQEIVPVPLGVDPIFFEPVSDAQRREVRERYALPERYVLHIGGSDPRKNLDRAMAGYLQGTTDLFSGEPPELVLAGAGAVSGGAKVLPYVRRADLPAVYRMALALLFPSLHEGFGLPVLEALACGTPVLTAETVAVLEFIPEAARSGGAVRACRNPRNTDEIAALCREAFSDLDALQHAALQGPAFAAPFTWEETARLTLAAYEQASPASVI